MNRSWRAYYGLNIIRFKIYTAIVFNRSKLESKGYKFINIEYTKEYLDKHPDLKEHVYGDDFDKKNIQKILKKDITWVSGNEHKYTNLN